MRVITRNFGEIEIEEQDVFLFLHGLPGFEDLRRFIILKPDEDVPLSYLQSVEEGELSFIIADPFLFYPDYELQLTESIQNELKVEQEQDVMVWSIVTVNDDIREATLNLIAPIIINRGAKLGKQIILHNTEYKTRHNLIPTEKAESMKDKG